MNRGIDPNAPMDACPRCGGRLPNAKRPARPSERACQCWDPLVEWLMDRADPKK